MPTGEPHPGGGIPYHLQADLANLAKDDLHQLMEDLCWEVTLCELNAPPEALHQFLGNPVWSGIPMQMTRRSPFPEGEGGFPLDNFSDLLPLHKQMVDGLPRDHLLTRCGCLINTLTSGLHLGAPRINTFSGEATPGKTEVSFKQWYHEVQCVKGHYADWWSGKA